MGLSSEPRFPHIEVQLIGEDGNAFVIIGRVLSAMKMGNVPRSIREDFRKESASGNYAHLVQTCMQYVTVKLTNEGNR